MSVTLQQPVNPLQMAQMYSGMTNGSTQSANMGGVNMLSQLGQGAQGMGNVIQAVAQLLQALAPLLQAMGGMSGAGQGVGQGLPQPPGAPMGGQGMPQQGIPQQGFPQQGIPQQGFPQTNAPQGFGQQSGMIPMDNDRAKREISNNFDKIAGKDGLVSINDLRAVAKGQIPKGMDNANFTPEFQAAARHIVQDYDKNKAAGTLDKSLFREMETAATRAEGKTARADGLMGKGDSTTILATTGHAVGDEQTLKTLAKYGHELFNGRGLFNKGDLEKIANTGVMPNGNQAPAELRAAAKDFLSKPHLEQRVDNAQKVSEGKGHEKGDDQYSVKDLNLAIGGPQRLKGGMGDALNAGERTAVRIFGGGILGPHQGT